MTNEKDAVVSVEPKETLFDDATAARVHDAWDALSPDEETLARMERRLVAAVEAQDADAASGVASVAQGDARGETTGTHSLKPGRVKRMVRWVRQNRPRVAAAAAIALVLVAGGAVTSAHLGESAQAPLGVSSNTLSGESLMQDAAQDTSSNDVPALDDDASDEEPISKKGTSDVASDVENKSYSGDKIVYTASVQVVTTDYEDARAALKEKAAAVKATVESERETTPYPGAADTESARPTLVVTYRVPTDALEAFIESLSDVGTVTSKTSDADNISQTYSETAARVKSLEIQKKRLEEMLEKTNDVDEMLQIEEQLQEVRSDLEYEKNEKSRMDTDIAFSKVMVTLVDVSELPEDASDESFGAQLGRAAAGAWKGFTGLLAGIVIFAVGVWPLWIVLAFAAAAVRAVRKKRGAKGDATPAAPEEGSSRE